MKIGEKLKENRTAAGLSQEALAERIGVSRQTISSWENDRSYPDIGSILKLSDLYSLSLDELLKEDENMRKHIEKSALSADHILNTLFVIAVLLVPASLLLLHWELSILGITTKVISMVLMLTVLIFRWKLSGDKWQTLAIGLVFWCVYYLPDLFIMIGNGTLTASISFEYLFFGILLLYSYGVIFITKLAFWQTIAIYFGVPLYIGISSLMPQILDSGLFAKPYDPFGYTYRVIEVYHGEAYPAKISLEGDGKTLNLDDVTIGEFVKQETEEGHEEQSWHLVPDGARSDLIVLRVMDAKGEYITLERRSYYTTPDGSENHENLWNIRLKAVPTFKQVIHQNEGNVRGTFANLVFWYPNEADIVPEEYTWPKPYVLNPGEEITLRIDNDTITKLHVITEYHSGKTVETAEYILNIDKSGEFPLPEEFYRDWAGEGDFLFFRIPWENGEYCFRLNLP